MMMLAALITVLCASITSGTDNCCFHVDHETRQIIDIQGRARLFHGVNVVVKTFPYHPDNTSFDSENSLSDEDVKFLQEHGFNVVRLYVAWPGVEPKKNQYNITYLNVLKDYVDKLGKAGIYTILDCHQDLLSPKFCGEGVPDYAALYMNRAVKPLPFPQPFPQFLAPFKINKTTGYPNRDDCNKYQFFTYYFSDAEGKAWQSIYDNEQELQDRFVLFWTKVSQHFSSNPYVLGYELINEPWAGDLETNPTHIVPRIADQKNLQPLYSNLFKAINNVDEEHLIFFEPTAVFTSLPFKNFSAAGFTEGPGGPRYKSRQVFSYHIYCILMDKDGQPASKYLCDLTDTDIFDARINDQIGLGVAGFMTEWGAYTNIVKESKAWNDAIDLTNLADKHLQSWTYWQYKGYDDITTQSNTVEGLFYKNGTVQVEKIALLTRTYAKSVTGRYVSQSFDIKTGLFQLTFKLDNSNSSPSEIYLNEKIHYPNGYTVNVDPEIAMTVQTDHNSVILRQTTGATTDMVIVVEIRRK